MESVRKTPAASSSSSLSLPQASKLTESSFPTEKKRTKSGASNSGEKVKAKKHKKHKHSHKHKSHKRHKSGGDIKEAKEARNTKYAVRSPVRAAEELTRVFTEEKDEAGDSSESDVEDHRDSGSDDEVKILVFKSFSFL